MITVARGLLFCFVFVTLVIFYKEGIDQFPDYSNYLTIAENKTGFVTERDYVFEWFSRLILGLADIDSTERVELLATLNQLGCLIYFFWAASRAREDIVFGSLILFSLLGFMFMTTTLRASIAYLCVSAFFLRDGKFDLPGLGLLLMSLAWHDSAAPVVLMCITALVLSNTFVSRTALQAEILSRGQKILVVVSLLIVLTSDLVRPALLSLSLFDLGARMAYFDGDGAYNIFKTIFVLIGILSCLFFVSDAQQNTLSRTFISLLAVIAALFYVANGTMAVRFIFFIFSVSIPLRGVVLFGVEKRPEVRLAALLILPVIFYLSILYIFSNLI